MRLINIDGSRWASIDDGILALLVALQAPESHGRNFNALVDSIAVGQINRIEPPYTIRIGGAARIDAETLAWFVRLRDFIHEVIADGVEKGRARRDVTILFEDA